MIIAIVAGVVILGLALGLGLGLTRKNRQGGIGTTSTATTGSTAGGAVVPWPQEESDIEVDPSVTFGTFPESGFRYMLMNNGEPPDKLALRLHVDAGSLHEDDDQRGLVRSLYILHFSFAASPSYCVPDVRVLDILSATDQHLT